MNETPLIAQHVPLQAVPTDAASQVADLGFAGRYIPAGEGGQPIAGDFYDVLALDVDRIALLVGDVSGHGPGALTRMQRLRAVAAAYAMERPGAADLVARLDRFCARLDSEWLATLWYAEYQPSTGLLAYAAAGHPPPLLTPAGKPTELLQTASAPPLGTGAAAEHVVEHRTTLPRGAVLVAYSDGLVERHRTDVDEQLAVLRAAVAEACDPQQRRTAQGIAAHVLAALVPEPSAAEDDVCLLVVRRAR